MTQEPNSGDSDAGNKSRAISPAMVMTLATVQVEGGLTVLAIIIAYFAKIPLREMFAVTPFAVVLGMLGTLPMFLLCYLVYKLPGKAIEFTRRFMKMMYHDFVRHCSVMQLLLMAILSGIGEELFFRGFLQTTIAHWCGGETRGLVIAIVITSILFGLAHPISKLYVFLCFVIGLYLGVIFAWSGNNLIAPILLHAIYNFVIFLNMPRMTGFSVKSKA